MDQTRHTTSLLEYILFYSPVTQQMLWQLVYLKAKTFT